MDLSKLECSLQNLLDINKCNISDAITSLCKNAEANHAWLDEILSACKSQFSSNRSKYTLLPKTPSQRHGAGKKKSKQYSIIQETRDGKNIAEEVSEMPHTPKRCCRHSARQIVANALPSGRVLRSFRKPLVLPACKEPHSAIADGSFSQNPLESAVDGRRNTGVSRLENRRGSTRVTAVKRQARAYEEMIILMNQGSPVVSKSTSVVGLGEFQSPQVTQSSDEDTNSITERVHNIVDNRSSLGPSSGTSAIDRHLVITVKRISGRVLASKCKKRSLKGRMSMSGPCAQAMQRRLEVASEEALQQLQSEPYGCLAKGEACNSGSNAKSTRIRLRLRKARKISTSHSPDQPPLPATMATASASTCQKIPDVSGRSAQAAGVVLSDRHQSSISNGGLCSTAEINKWSLPGAEGAVLNSVTVCAGPKNMVGMLPPRVGVGDGCENVKNGSVHITADLKNRDQCGVELVGKVGVVGCLPVANTNAASISHHSAAERRMGEAVDTELAFDCGSPPKKYGRLSKCVAGKQRSDSRVCSNGNDLMFSDKGSAAVPPAIVEVDGEDDCAHQDGSECHSGNTISLLNSVDGTVGTGHPHKDNLSSCMHQDVSESSCGLKDANITAHGFGSDRGFTSGRRNASDGVVSGSCHNAISGTEQASGTPAVELNVATSLGVQDRRTTRVLSSSSDYHPQVKHDRITAQCTRTKTMSTRNKPMAFELPVVEPVQPHLVPVECHQYVSREPDINGTVENGKMTNGMVKRDYCTRTKTLQSGGQHNVKCPVVDSMSTSPQGSPKQLCLTRTENRKRQAGEDIMAELSSPKRSCMTDIASSKGHRAVQDVMQAIEENDSDYEDIEPVTPSIAASRKVPSFMRHMRKSSFSQSARLVSSVVSSFLRRNTATPQRPSFQVQHEQKKKDFLQKEKREQERLSRLEVVKRNKADELRRKREERMRKVTEVRELRQRNEADMRINMMEKLKERLNSTDKLKEEKLKEEREKQRMRQKRQMEVEEKRHQEEMRLRRIHEQQEEEKRLLDERLQRQHEKEEHERCLKLADERQRQAERVAELERVRQMGLERLQEREREKELKLKALAVEKAARERQEIERKKEREQRMQRELEKLKELEQKRLARVAQEEREKEREATKLRQMLQQHNGKVQAMMSKCDVTGTSGHNSIQQANPQHASKHPVTTVKDAASLTVLSGPSPISPPKPANTLNDYDITDRVSGDSTDDERAPKKRIATWAQNTNLKILIIQQSFQPHDLDVLFPPMGPPDLNEMFDQKRSRFNKRTSSAVWTSPIQMS